MLALCMKCFVDMIRRQLNAASRVYSLLFEREVLLVDLIMRSIFHFMMQACNLAWIFTIDFIF